MSALPMFAAVAALAAAFVGLVRPEVAPGKIARILAVLAALATVPSLEEPAAWPWVALVAGAAVFATPLPCLLAAAAAAHLAFGLPASPATALGAPVLAALALAMGAASLASEGGAWLRSGGDLGWPAAWAGLGFCGVAALQGQREILAWRFSLGGAEAALSIPGAGLLFGLAVVVTLAGSLALAAHLLTPHTPSAPVRRLGQRALVLGAGLAILAVGFALVRGYQAPEALGTGGLGLVGLMLATAGQVAALVVLLGAPPTGEPEPLRQEAGLEAQIGCVLAVAAAAMAGFESWLRLGSYASPLTAASASAALLGLAALEPTKLGLPRKALWLVALAFVVAA